MTTRDARAGNRGVARAAAAAAARARRDQVFAEHPGLFGDPAWEILLHMYAGDAPGLPEHLAPSVARRYAEALVGRGLLARRGATLDDAAALRLTAQGRALLERFFAE